MSQNLDQKIVRGQLSPSHSAIITTQSEKTNNCQRGLGTKPCQCSCAFCLTVLRFDPTTKMCRPSLPSLPLCDDPPLMNAAISISIARLIHLARNKHSVTKMHWGFPINRIKRGRRSLLRLGKII
jgi:hypothetical protein